MFQMILDEINNDLNRLELTGLIIVNEGKYNYFKKQYSLLKRKLLEYADDMRIKGLDYNWNLPIDFKAHYANLTVEFDFYLKSLGGNKNIYDYRINNFLEKLQELLAKLTDDNYEEVTSQLEEKISFYKKIDGISLEDDRIRNILTEFHYKLLKYKIKKLVIDDTCSVQEYLPFIIFDIKLILNSNETPHWVREELSMYLLDSNSIVNNLVKVILLINIGLNKENVTEEELETLLSKTYYKESEIKKEYHEPSKEIKGDVSTVSIDDIDKVFRYHSIGEEIKEMVPAAILKNLNIYGCIKFDTITKIVDTLISRNFLDVKYLAEALIIHKQYELMYQFRDNYKTRSNKLYLEFDKAVIAYLGDLDSKCVADYIIKSGNRYLISYIISNGNKAFFTKELIKWAINENIRELIAYIEANNLLTIEVILSYVFEVNDKFFNYCLENIISSNDINTIIRFIDRWDDKIYYDSVFLLIDSISNDSLKEKVLNYFYEEISTKTTRAYNYLIRYKSSFPKTSTSKSFIIKFNIFEASILSDGIIASDDIDDVNNFVSKYYMVRLNWQNIIQYISNYHISKTLEILKYFYLGNRYLFFELINVNSTIANYIIKEIPESINDFLCYLSISDIIQLPEATLVMFANNLEEELRDKNITLEEYLLKYLEDTRLLKKPLAYIMYRGLLDTKLMFYLNKVMFSTCNGKNYKNVYSSLILQAIKKAKKNYLRPSMILQGLNGMPIVDDKDNRIDWNIVFLSDYELQLLMENQDEDEEIKNLKLRKYYGDLLKLIDLVPSNIQMRIIISLAQSGIKEYLQFILSNYPEYREIVLANISDSNLYHELIGFNGTMSIDDALRVEMLSDRNSRK